MNVLLSGFTLFLRFINQPKTIEYQISDEIGADEESIKFFDEQYFGQYQIVGFEYASEKYGVARIHVSEDQKSKRSELRIKCLEERKKYGIIL